MTPKELYEARKAERQKLKDMDFDIRNKTESIIILDMLDRFVTAAERIADALEPPAPGAHRNITAGMSENGVG